MRLYTKAQITPFAEQIDHSNSIFSVGSCFAENIAAKLRQSKFEVCSSPTGTLFNPESIALTVERMAAYNAGDINALPQKDELQYANGRWFHYHFHSSFSHPDAETALEQMQRAVKMGAEALKLSDTVIITFGTAMVYRLIGGNQSVANCHKQPQRLFCREMLDVESIVRRYLKLCLSVFAQKRVIFTVSPIRHLSDGLETNSLSKAILRVALGRLTQLADNVEYFPSFEIMNDELRDYRFYADDMVHPTPLAINYIWQRFKDAAISDSTQQLLQRIEQISTAAAHRPFNPSSEQHKTFCRKMIQDIEELQREYPRIDLSKEKESFSGYL